MTSVPLRRMWMTPRWTAADVCGHRATRGTSLLFSSSHQLIKSSDRLFENLPASLCFLSLIYVG